MAAVAVLSEDQLSLYVSMNAWMTTSQLHGAIVKCASSYSPWWWKFAYWPPNE